MGHTHRQGSPKANEASWRAGILRPFPELTGNSRTSSVRDSVKAASVKYLTGLSKDTSPRILYFNTNTSDPIFIRIKCQLLGSQAVGICLDSNFARELCHPALGRPSSASPGCRYLPSLEGPAGLGQEVAQDNAEQPEGSGDTLPDAVTGSATAVPRRLARDSVKYTLGSVWPFKRKSVKPCSVTKAKARRVFSLRYFTSGFEDYNAYLGLSWWLSQ